MGVGGLSLTKKLNNAGYSADEEVTKCHVRGEVSLGTRLRRKVNRK